MSPVGAVHGLEHPCHAAFAEHRPARSGTARARATALGRTHSSHCSSVTRVHLFDQDDGNGSPDASAWLRTSRDRVGLDVPQSELKDADLRFIEFGATAPLTPKGDRLAIYRDCVCCVKPIKSRTRRGRRNTTPGQQLTRRGARKEKVKHPEDEQFVIKYFDLIDEFIKVRSCSDEVLMELDRSDDQQQGGVPPRIVEVCVPTTSEITPRRSRSWTRTTTPRSSRSCSTRSAST